MGRLARIYRDHGRIPRPPPFPSHLCLRPPSTLVRAVRHHYYEPPPPPPPARYRATRTHLWGPLSLSRSLARTHTDARAFLLALRAASFLARSHGRARGATEYLRSCFSSRPTPRPYPRPSFLSTPFLLLLLLLFYASSPHPSPFVSFFFPLCTSTHTRASRPLPHTILRLVHRLAPIFCLPRS